MGGGRVCLAGLLVVAGCGDAPRLEMPGESQTGTDGGPPAASDTTTSSDGDDSTGAGSRGGGSSSGDEAPVLDVGVPDAGSPGGGGACAEAEEELASQGCLFWAVDLPNSREPAPGGVAETQQYAVVVANSSPTLDANVRVYVADDNEPIDEAVVGPEDTHTFALPAASIDPTQTTDDGLAYRVESDVPLVAYQFNPLQNSGVYSNDATVLWPDHVLTTDYTAVTDNATSHAPTYISVVATEDDTHVEVFPTTTLAGAGDPEATLDRGEVFTVVSVLSTAAPPNNGNLSGSRVVADKPVAAFAGNVSAPIIPAGSGWEGGSRICCADHMEHQLIPLQAWGTTHVVATPAPAYYTVDPARYRITGAFDDTTLVWDPAPPPGAPDSIGAGETAVFDTDASFIVASADDDKPFSIAQFLPSGDTTDSLFDDQRAGDPAMIILPPREQFVDKYVFAIPAAYAHHALTVVAQDDTMLELDGSAVTAPFLPLASGWSYAHIPIGEGTHVLTGTAGFGLTVAGYDVEVSYGFAGGSGFEPLTDAPPPPG